MYFTLFDLLRASLMLLPDEGREDIAQEMVNSRFYHLHTVPVCIPLSQTAQYKLAPCFR